MKVIFCNSSLAASGVTLILVLCWCAGLRFNPTPSLPKGVYRLAPGVPEKNDLVNFCLEGDFAELALERGYLEPGSCPSGLRPLLKRLAALPGVVPPGMALVLADHPGSFDSRYFGFVPLDSLKRVEPDFVFNPKGK
jgi:type IV secretory pathway protease TraF